MHSPIAKWVKQVLPARRWRVLRRATNRLRWLLKFQLLRQYNFPIAQRPLRALKYVLFDPEVESFSYALANEPELATFLSQLLGVPRDQIVAWLEEAKTDPVLARDRGFHWSSKRRQPLGNRLMWYPIVRATRPRVIVEAGVHEGLGSEVLLRALARNKAEGHPGQLISFDIHEDTGWLVAPELKDGWQVELESSLTGIERAVAGREIDMFIHETPHTEEFISTELDAVFRNAGPRVVVVDSSGLNLPTMRQYCERYGATHHYFLDQPKDHIVKSFGTGFAIFEREKLQPARRTVKTPAETESSRNIGGATAQLA